MEPPRATVSSTSNNKHQKSVGQQNSTAIMTLDENGCPTSARLSALIKRLLPGKDYYPDKSFIFAFLLNARLFISPSDLMHKILQLFIFEQNSKNDNFKKEARVKFFYNLMKLLADWSDMFPYDFRSDQLKCRFKELLDICCSADPALKFFRLKLQQNLFEKLTKLERFEKTLTELPWEMRTSSSVELSAICIGLSEKCYSNPKHLAQQLTIMELDRLSVIGPEEFVYAFSVDNYSTDTISTCSMDSKYSMKFRTARNIEHYISWCNRLSYLVATEVCRHIRKKHRIRVIEFFIDVAKECVNMGNFNSLVAIATAINMNPVNRLKKTWSKINKSKWKILEHQTDPVGNFLSYRSTLKAAIWRSESASKSSEKIVIPAFCVLFRDLFALHDRCRTPLSNGHINFNAFKEFAQQLSLFIQCKSIKCPFERDETLIRYMLTCELFDDNSLLLASYEYEQPETVCEKELYKRLK